MTWTDLAWWAVLVVTMLVILVVSWRIARRTTDIRGADLIERLFWTFVSSFLGGLVVTSTIVDVSVLAGAFLAAAIALGSAVVNWVLVLARHRLDVLPDPGDMGGDAARSRTRHPTR